jgi:hypothetical protein
MAATNFTPISLYYSTTASAAPSAGNLVAGELALNTLDEKLYFKNSAGTVKLLASVSGATGTVSSVAASVPAFLSIAGSPITTSGTLAITYSGTALPIANGGTGTTSTTFANLTTNVTGTLPVANGGTGQTTYTDGQLLIGNSTGNTLTKATLTAGSGVTITNGSGGITIAATGSGGSVTSVAQSFTGGIVSVAGSPITGAGTLALTVAGTSGGVPYFSSASTWASSAALTQYGVVYGGGAGVAPAATSAGTSTTVLHGNASGAPTFGAVSLTADVSGTLPIANGGTNSASTPTAGGAIYGTGTAYAITAAGTSGQYLQSNGASAPTWVTPTGGAGSLTAVASGALANGDKVVVNSNGTVSVVSGSYSALTVGTNVQFSSTYTGDYMSTAYDASSGKIVMVYQGTSGFGYGMVGTVSGTSISFGTPVSFKSEVVSWLGVAFVSSASKVVVSFRENTNSRAVLGTVSGTTISFSASDNAFATNTDYNRVIYDSTNDRIVLSYRNLSNGWNYGTAIVGTVSGSAISYGTAVAYDLNNSDYIELGFDSTAGNVIIGYRSNGAGRVIAGTVSGTTITFGSNVSFDSAGAAKCQGIAFSVIDNKSVVIYQRAADNYGVAKVLTLSGTAISLGAENVFQASAMNPYATIVYDGNIKKTVIVNALGQAMVGTISGTTMSFATPVTYASAIQNLQTAATYDSVNKKVVLSSRITSLAGYYATVVNGGTLTTNLTGTNYIGISNAAYADGATATIQIVGSVDDAQSGLTAGQAYYITGTGALSTTADSPVVFAGTAVSATNLIVKG